MNSLKQFLKEIEHAFEHKKLLKISLGHPKRHDKNLALKVRIRPITIKNRRHLSFVQRFKTKDETQNFLLNEGLEKISELLTSQFQSANLFTTQKELELRINKKGNTSIKELQATRMHLVEGHDKAKTYAINPDRKWLQSLGISSSSGKVKADKMAKFKQINQFIQLFEMHCGQFLSEREMIRIADVGSGKAYLTFALYDFLKNRKGLQIELTGIERRADLVEKSQQLAQDCGFNDLHFEHSDIAEASLGDMDVVLALHACNTATDDAIIRAVQQEVPFILVAPCCQHYVRKHMAPPSPWKTALSDGIIQEKMASLMTDSLRALCLRYLGYHTRIMEFIDSVHTPKNNLIVARKVSQQANSEKISAEISGILNQLGINDFYLDRKLGLNFTQAQTSI